MHLLKKSAYFESLLRFTGTEGSCCRQGAGAEQQENLCQGGHFTYLCAGTYLLLQALAGSQAKEPASKTARVEVVAFYESFEKSLFLGQGQTSWVWQGLGC